MTQPIAYINNLVVGGYLSVCLLGVDEDDAPVMYGAWELDNYLGAYNFAFNANLKILSRH